MKRRLNHVVPIAALTMATLLAETQDIGVDWSNISGSGGLSVGGEYSVSGTVGQPDVGLASGGDFSLQGGFWSLVTVVQTPDVPVVSVNSSGPNVVISWQGMATRFRLETSLALSPINGWTQVTAGSLETNGVISVTLPMLPGSSFFRLRKIE